MTRHQWLVCHDPEAMLEFALSQPGDSKLDDRLRRFACTVVRRVWDKLVDARGAAAIETAEYYLLKQATLRALEKASSAALDAAYERDEAIADMDPSTVTLDVMRSASYLQAAAHASAGDVRNGARLAASLVAGTFFPPSTIDGDTAAELAAQADLLRVIFGDSLQFGGDGD